MDTWNPLPNVPGHIQLGQADCPVVLLFHGLDQTGACWHQPSVTGYNYDYQHDPQPQHLGEHDLPAAGFYKAGRSDHKEVDSHNWFDFLVSLGFTVAEWSQPGETFAEALPSAVAAFDKVLVDSERLNPGSPPPVALLGHSRGGLLIREVMKERGTQGRVRWAITLHSPHGGSDLGQTPAGISTDWMDRADFGPLLNPHKNEIKAEVGMGLQPLTDIINSPAEQELAPGSPLLRSIADGEQPLAGVKYITFGGTSTTFFREYAWNFTANSALVSRIERHGLGWQAFYDWNTVPAEITAVSPVLDSLRGVTPEVMPGAGDGLVANERAKLPWSTHFVNHLNHAEVLWNVQVQGLVADQLFQQPLPIPIALNPSVAQVNARQTQRFVVQPSGSIGVTFSIDGPARPAELTGWIDQDGVYHAPNFISQALALTVRATAVDGSGRTATASVRLVPNVIRPHR